MTLLVLNGPNLNLLGTREPDTYGPAALTVFKKGLQDIFPTVDFRFESAGSTDLTILGAASQGSRAL